MEEKTRKRRGRPPGTNGKVYSAGDVVGRWTITGEAVRLSGLLAIHYPCRCECGTESYISIYNLRSGYSRSCGCLAREILGARVRVHGDSATHIYNVWSVMRGRCRGTHNRKRPRKDLPLCQEWENYEAFKEWSLANGYREGLVLDRIDKDKGFSPDNCRWRTECTMSGKKSNNRLITAWGETKYLSEWARDKRCTITRQALHKRLSKGWPPEVAISKPAEWAA